jgi:hypothetical protein
VQQPWPTFADGFLDGVLAGLARRRRAMRYHGALSVQFSRIPDIEWFAVTIEVMARRAITLWLWPRHRASLRVSSTWVRDRGRTLLDLDDLRLAAEPARIIAAFEATAHQVAIGNDPSIFAVPVEILWDCLRLRSI